jgi:predicted deacylase
MFETRPKAILILCFLMCGSLFSGTNGQEVAPFQLGQLKVPPGEMRSHLLPVEVEEDMDCFIPVTVLHGAKPGKVLALVAGVHGYEYPPILALYRLKEKIDPRYLSGTLILVHIANLPAFQKRIIYYNPYDWKNLNRVFPGNPEGSQAERIAYVLVERVVKACDALIDLHCGDGNEALIPYCYWMLSGNEELNERSREMVLAFGIKHIIIDQTRSPDIKASKYLGNTAVLHGKPAITTESGYLGGSDELDIQRNVHGVLNVMRLFGMIEGRAQPVKEPVWIDKYEVVYSQDSGLFHPLTQMGYYVKAGEKVGYVTDYLGRMLHEYRAPFTGIMLYILGTPPANLGEPLFEVGRIKQ